MNWFGKQGMVFFRGGIPILKGRRCSSSRLRIEIADFGLTQGVLDRKPLSLSIECHLRLCVEKYPQEANAVMLCWSMAFFMVEIKPKPRPDWSLLGLILVLRPASPTLLYGRVVHSGNNSSLENSGSPLKKYLGLK